MHAQCITGVAPPALASSLESLMQQPHASPTSLWLFTARLFSRYPHIFRCCCCCCCCQWLVLTTRVTLLRWLWCRAGLVGDLDLKSYPTILTPQPTSSAEQCNGTVRDAHAAQKEALSLSWAGWMAGGWC